VRRTTAVSAAEVEGNGKTECLPTLQSNESATSTESGNAVPSTGRRKIHTETIDI